jgi:hypothetical protein
MSTVILTRHEGEPLPPQAMKDRSNVAALALTLEAIVMAVARAHVAKLDDAGKQTFAKEIAANVDTICAELVALAPVTGRGANLAPAAAKAAAARIRADAQELVKDFAADLVPAK